MRKIAIWGVLALMALAIAAVPALAATNFNNAPSGAHYRQGSVEPVCTTSTANNGTITVSCTGTQIAGVGNTNADLLLTINAQANFTCSNPGSKDNVVEPHSGFVTDSTFQTLEPSRNGTLVVGAKSVSLSPQEAGEQFTCPNTNWTENFVGFSNVSYTYTLTFDGFDQPAISLP
jgi:hypothetical protein